MSVDHTNRESRGKWCAQRCFNHVSSPWWTERSSVWVAPATLSSSLCHPVCLFPHISSLQGALHSALSCYIHEGSSITSAHWFCWIIWRSHATQQHFHAAVNQMCNSAEPAFFMCRVINKHILMKICDFTNELRHILSNPEDAKYPGDQRPHVCLCLYVLCMCVCV